MDSTNNIKTTQQHPVYWFEDGSLVLDVEEQSFKIHHSLVTRHSQYLSSLTKGPVTVQPNGSHATELLSNGQSSKAVESELKRIAIDPKRNVRPEDVDALLQHLYHDKPLAKESQIAHVASILHVSSPAQLDFPDLHGRARETFEGLFPTDPCAFTHNHPRHEALPVATALGLHSARKAILYSLVTMTEFAIADESPDSASDNDALKTKVNPTEPVLSREDAAICTELMTRLIEHFTPILFTVGTTSHMECTDIFAETWMPLVIQPALEDDGVYKPLESLQRIKEIDWERHGLCASCVAEKREEWEGEQRIVWDLMDTWLGHGPSS